MERTRTGVLVRSDAAARSLAATLALGVLAAAALAAGPAEAQDRQAQARALFERGVAAMDSGNPGAAAEHFQQSYQIYPRASTACNMALALERTGRGCDAQSWYRQCAALDQAGRFRDHANRQAAALAGQCQQQAAQDPFRGGASVGGANPSSSSPSRTGTSTSGGIEVVEAGDPQTLPEPRVRRSTSFVLLGLGIAAAAVGVGAIVGGAFAAGEANAQADLLPPGGGVLVEGTLDADRYEQAQTYSALAIGLYVTGAGLGVLGAVLMIVDLARAASGGRAQAPFERGPRLTVGPTPGGGAYGQLSLAF